MKFSLTARGLTIGFAVAVLSIAAGYTGSCAAAHKLKPVIDKAPRYIQDQNVKLRYYGGPKNPMYP